ncbi:MAG: hypothetical protein A2285_03780, partial [Elusimicrobia bacterium RIFOXYA12_FULL_57_11]
VRNSGSKFFCGFYFYPSLLALILVPLYIYCLPPGLPPYRDSGEMACAAWTLGIAHQPGYPLYIILAKLFSLIPLGNPAWRLNLFSAAAGLAGVFVFWRFASRSFSPLAAFFAALTLGFNFTLRTVSSVPEMYALNFFFACLLLAVAIAPWDEDETSTARMFLAAFLLGFGMTNRMDLLLAAPAVLILLWPVIKANGPVSLVKATGFALLGFSLYLYLLVRSSGNPLFDWSHPAEFKTFLAVITRKSYGSTLDLISRNYPAGALFLPGLKYYALHLWENFTLALFFCLAGIYWEWRSNRRRCLAIAALFVFSGPVFIFMANMPPNPHSLAIVEPYYLLPDLALAVWAAAGFFYLAGLFPKALLPLAFAFLLAAGAVCYNGAYGAQRRLLFAAEDYAADVARTAPPGSVIVGKKDVQLFSLWYMQAVEGRRPDLQLVAQGLSGAPWYNASAKLYRPGLTLFNLNSGGEKDWAAFRAANSGGFYATMDAELPRGVPARAVGLLNELYSGAGALPPGLWDYYSLGRLNPAYRDFFDRDIGTSYSQALLARAVARNSAGALDAAGVAELRLARRFDADIPEAPLYEGFYHSGRGDWAAAGACFRESIDVFERLLLLSEKYYSLPAAKQEILFASAYAWLNYGVSLEKRGDAVGAEQAYSFALSRKPELAEAHFNLAVLYWGRDFARVRHELDETLRLNPGHAGAVRYLEQISNK